MRDETGRVDSLRNISAMLRMAAETMRLFSDSEKVGGASMSDVTMLSLRVEECAAELDDLARKEIDDATRSCA